MKQVKRIRYGQKELEQLKTVLEKAKENDAKIASEVTMADADNNQLYSVVTRQTRRSRPGREESEDQQEVTEESMDTTAAKKIRIFDPSTMKDQHGQTLRVTLSLATITAIVATALLAIAFSTDNWLFTEVKRSQIKVAHNLGVQFQPHNN
ncbi:hypothetical protein GE061_004396 [Apolygus lucorum]|uniref:Uncharacterized protein n=1 Tax=Apolygus lucorum TaxID=248454 RepID=A0A8S9WYK4_APOLU|nr:hypothetical protein GE061_004396 [Apolygus lucorum]